MNDMQDNVITIRPLDLDIINPNPRNYMDPNQGGSKIFIIGKPGSGKSTLIKSLFHNKSQIIPVAQAMSGTESETGFYREFIPDPYIYDEYDSDVLSNCIIRQKGARKHMLNPWTMLIIDDCMDDPSVFNKPPQPGLFKNGRHWKMLYIISLQYSLDVKPPMRGLIDGVFIFRESNFIIRRKLYENYAGIIPSFNLFEQIMDFITSDYTALYIQNATNTNDWRQCVFYYKAPIIENFKFGCQEYRGYAQKIRK
jgi:energy-coupling factor transporter ATP-binding protein EcfA2